MFKMLIYIAYFIFVVFTINLVIATVKLVKDNRNELPKNKIIANFFKNVVYRWFGVLNWLFFLI